MTFYKKKTQNVGPEMDPKLTKTDFKTDLNWPKPSKIKTCRPPFSSKPYLSDYKPRLLFKSPIFKATYSITKDSSKSDPNESKIDFQ